MLTWKESPKLTKVQTGKAGFLVAILLEQPREKMPDLIQWALCTIVYPSEIADIMETVIVGRSDALSKDPELAGGQIAVLNDGCAAIMKRAR
jgi:hypothetical protein